MSSNVIPETHPERGSQDPYNRQQPMAEMAPSALSDADPGVARAIGLASALLVMLCGVFLAVNLYNGADPTKYHFPTGWLTVGLVLGIIGLLFHAAYDHDVQFRRLYLIFGGAAIIVGAFLCVLPNPAYGAQFRSGYPCMALALIFILAALRHETDTVLRAKVDLGLGILGALMILIGVIGGNYLGEFLLPYGMLLTILGLCYMAGFIVTRGVSDDLAYHAGWALGGVGLIVFLVAFFRSMLPPLFFRWGWRAEQPLPYLMPYGLLLIVLGLTCLGVAALLCSESRLVVLTRRELIGFFYSPVAYFVLIGFTIVIWVGFWLWVPNVTPPRATGPLDEPVVGGFLLQWPGVLLMLFGVPALTMRLLSEEKRSGTLEVLMTTPTDETTVVLSKFLAGYLLFMLMWLPFGLFTVAFRIMGDAPFDYLPLLGFGVALLVTGAAFTAMGLFFSSVTNSQIVSAILTFAIMMLMTFIWIIKVELMRRSGAGSTDNLVKGAIAVIEHISYLELWISSFSGKLAIRQLLFQISMAIWWLFITVKVLEARRWT